MDKVTRGRHAKQLAHKIAAQAIERFARDVRRADTQVTTDGEPDGKLREAVLAELDEQAEMHHMQARMFQDTFDRHEREGKAVASVAVTMSAAADARDWETFGPKQRRRL